MSAAQINLLKRLISAERNYWQAEPATRHWDMLLVEVGAINGVSHATARSLIDAGLANEEMPSWATETTGTHIRLSEAI